jgi:hypothetical protein
MFRVKARTDGQSDLVSARCGPLIANPKIDTSVRLRVRGTRLETTLRLSQLMVLVANIGGVGSSKACFRNQPAPTHVQGFAAGGLGKAYVAFLTDAVQER